jgi:hypothetical protein
MKAKQKRLTAPAVIGRAHKIAAFQSIDIDALPKQDAPRPPEQPKNNKDCND